MSGHNIGFGGQMKKMTFSVRTLTRALFLLLHVIMKLSSCGITLSRYFDRFQVYQQTLFRDDNIESRKLAIMNDLLSIVILTVNIVHHNNDTHTHTHTYLRETCLNGRITLDK